MADETLKSVRPSFVAQVNKAMIGQLLDHLSLDKVLNKGEREWILEENNVKADVARRLIDTVTSKGDKASRKMIGYIESEDPTLHSELHLPRVLLAPPAEPQGKQDQSTSPSPSTSAATSENQDDIYPVTDESYKNRVALLITNIKFADGKLNRNGAEKDEDNMERLFKSLGYEVVKHRNRTGKEIDEDVIKFSEHPKLKATDSVVVVIMSHGKLGAVLGFNSTEEKPDEFPIDNIYKHLGSKNCPDLCNKPKIIIIQACRGVEGGSAIVDDCANPAVLCDHVTQPGSSASAGERDIAEDTLRYVHKEKDFISLLSCTPDTVSYRHTSCGSFLIQYVDKVFNDSAKRDHIEELFRKVLKMFENFSIEDRRQMPTKDRCTLPRFFYFNRPV